jgi:hypothetical protein
VVPVNKGRYHLGRFNDEPVRTAPPSRLGAALATGILLAIVILSALVFLPLTSAPQLKMTVLRDSVQEVGYGESAIYYIDVRNTGDGGTRVFDLELTEVPDAWETELSHRSLSLSSQSHRKVVLTVTAPTRQTVEEAGEGAIDRVASIGVRSGNVSVGTVTILTGQLTLERAGESHELDPDDPPYFVEPGDLLTSSGLALVELDMDLLFPGAGQGGELYLGLNEASIGIWRQNETAYIWISSGTVVIYWPGDSGGGGGNRADGSEWNMIFDNVPNVDEAFPDLEYSSVISFQANADPVLFHVGALNGDIIPVSVYDGTLNLATSESEITLAGLESVRVTPGNALPDEPEPLYGIILETRSGDKSGSVPAENSVEETITVDGKNFFAVGNGPDDAVVLSGIGGRNIYFIPVSRGYIPDVTVTHNGRTEGFYRTTISYIGNYTTTSFEFSSSSTSVTQDVVMFSFTSSTLSGSTLVVEQVNEEERGKSYDLGMSYMKMGMKREIFNITSMATSNDTQIFRVIDWTSFDLPGAIPVHFSQGGVTVPVEDGDTGEDIRWKMQAPDDDDDDSDLVMLYQAIGVAVMVLVLMVGILIGTRKRKVQSRKSTGKKVESTVSFRELDQEMMAGTGEGEPDRGLPGPGVEWSEPMMTETVGEKTVSEETRDITTLDPIEESQSAFFARWGAEELESPVAVETETEKEAEMDEKVAEGKEGETEREEKEEKELAKSEPLMPGFPVKVECHVCGKDYNIKTPSIYKCKQCNTPFKIDKKGKYIKPMKKMGSDKPDKSGTGSDVTDKGPGETAEGPETEVPPEEPTPQGVDAKITIIPPCPNCGKKGNRITDEFIGEVRCKRCFIKYFVPDKPQE